MLELLTRGVNSSINAKDFSAIGTKWAIQFTLCFNEKFTPCFTVTSRDFFLLPLIAWL